MKKLMIMIGLVVFGTSLYFTESSDLYAKSESDLQRKQRTEWRRFYRESSGSLPQTSIGIEFYNEAVKYFRDQEYSLARDILYEAIAVDPKAYYAYELLGDISQAEYRLEEAKEHFKKSFMMKVTPRVKQKLEKLNRELELDSKLQAYVTEDFVIKYQEAEVKDLEALAEIIDKAYKQISKTFAYRFDRPLVVIVTSPDEFAKIVRLPHWVSGLYDGKVRLPTYGWGSRVKEFEAVAAHEITHAFIAAMSASRTPAWLNEGLAEYIEKMFLEPDRIVFRAAIRTGDLLSFDQLMNVERLTEVKDPLWVNLFYEQSAEVVEFLIDKYGLFRVRQLLKEFGRAENYEEALQKALGVGPDELEVLWRATLPVNSAR